MSADDFFASPRPVTPAYSPFTPTTAPVRPAPAHFPLGRLLAGGLLLLALLVGLAIVLWPHSSGTNKPDTGMARLFGQQTRTQLPQPVTADDCTAAVRAFPAVARDSSARAAFIDGCLHP